MSLFQQMTMSAPHFLTDVYLRQPYASPNGVPAARNLFAWPMLNAICNQGYADTWLAREGHLPTGATGTLTYLDAQKGFADGRTIFVRHSERAHPALQQVASEFGAAFRRPIDIQLYATPAQNEGFNWHYDIEDVFVFQSVGNKEFVLRPNTVVPNPRDRLKPDARDFLRETTTQQIRCELRPGDWLYIPAGYWHKARALTDSFHLSVGVLNRENGAL